MTSQRLSMHSVADSLHLLPFGRNLKEGFLRSPFLGVKRVLWVRICTNRKRFAFKTSAQIALNPFIIGLSWTICRVVIADNSLPTLPFVPDRLGCSFIKCNAVSKASSNFSGHEYRQRLRTIQRGVSPIAPP